MDRAASTVPSATEPALTFVRVFDAPRTLVYRVWTETGFVEQWWGCEGSTAASCAMDVRVGGSWHIAIRTPDGVVHANGGQYLEVIENERLVYTDGPSVSTISFTDEADGTRVTLHIRLQSLADRDGMLEAGVVIGIEQSLDRVALLLARAGRQ